MEVVLASMVVVMEYVMVIAISVVVVVVRDRGGSRGGEGSGW